MRTLILMGAAIMVVGLSASSAMAGEYVVTANGTPYTGAMHAELEGGSWTITAGAGQALTCNQSHLTGSITSSEAGPGSTVNGTLNTWTFAYNNNSFCPATFPGLTSCETEVLNLPYAIRLNTTNHAQPTLSLSNALFELHCNSFIGRIECRYQAAVLVANVVGDEVRFVNQPLTSVVPFPCPATPLTLTATYDLRTTGSNFPITLVEQ